MCDASGCLAARFPTLMVKLIMEKEEFMRLLASASPTSYAAIFGKNQTVPPGQQACAPDGDAAVHLSEAPVTKYAQAENDLKTLNKLKDELLKMASAGLRSQSE